MSQRPAHARVLFAPLGPTYDRVGAVLSFGQDPRWRRLLVGLLPRDGGHVLDVATGTGLVADALLRRGFRVTGLDQSPEMLARARERFGDRVELVEASADALPVADASFDHLTFTYLLRYVDDPGATLVELARVVRPGGTVAMLEFGLPRGVWRPPWNLWVDIGLPLAGRLISPWIPRAASGAGAVRALARGGDRRRPRAPSEPRRRAARLGATWRALAIVATRRLPSTRSSRAAGATT
jgi:demethylmenaquinone methyltransferase/2-methoxy-6-polyprenyl-1,4-benzoquinol methylase